MQNFQLFGSFNKKKKKEKHEEERLFKFLKESEVIYRYEVDDTINCTLFVCLSHHYLASMVVEMLEFHLMKVLMNKSNGYW